MAFKVRVGSKPLVSVRVSPEEILTSDLQAAAGLFGKLKVLRLRLTQVDEASLDRAFEKHVQSVLDKLDGRLSSLGEGELQRQSEIVMAKHGLMDASFQQVILLCQGISPALGDVLKELRVAHSGYLTELQQCVGKFTLEAAAQAAAQSAQKEKEAILQSECSSLLNTISLLDAEAEEHKGEILRLRTQLRNALQKMAVVENGSGTVASSSSSSSSTSQRKQQHQQPPPFDTSLSSSPQKSISTSSNLSSRNGNGERTAKSIGGGKGGGVATTAENWLFVFRQEIQKSVDSGRCRVNTKNECRDIVEWLYRSKAGGGGEASQDELQVLSPAHMITMEHHTYKEFEKKYGLRGMAVEHAASFIQGLEVNNEEGSGADNSLTVFLRIFRNQVEEEFVGVQEELLASIRDLLMVQIMAKNASKDKAVLAALLERKLSTSIGEDEWTNVLQHLYNASDAAAVGLIVKRLAVEARAQKKQQQQQQQQAVGDGGDGNGDTELSQTAATIFRSSNTRLIGYSSPTFKNKILKGPLSPPPAPLSAFVLRLQTPIFLKAVLDFQLFAHEQFLRPLSKAFSDVDVDRDGYINSSEFGNVVARLKGGEKASGFGGGGGVGVGAGSKFEALFPPKVSFSQAALFFSRGKILASSALLK